MKLFNSTLGSMFAFLFFIPMFSMLGGEGSLGGASISTDANGSPVAPADNNVSAEEVEEPLPPDEKKSDDSDRVEENIKADDTDAGVRPIGCGASEPTETDNGDIKGTDSSDQ